MHNFLTLRGVGTAGATGTLAPAMLKLRGRREYLFAPAIFSHIFACCSFNFHSLSLCCLYIQLKRHTQLVGPTTGRIHTHTHTFNGPLSGTTRVSRYQKGKTNLDFTEARDSEWQWNLQGHMQVCNSLQTDNHASTSPLSFLQTGCLSCRPTNSVKAQVEYYKTN